MNAVHHMQHSGLRVQIYVSFGVDNGGSGALDLVEAREILRCGQGVADERPAAVAARMLAKRHHAR